MSTPFNYCVGKFDYNAEKQDGFQRKARWVIILTSPINIVNGETVIITGGSVVILSKLSEKYLHFFITSS